MQIKRETNGNSNGSEGILRLFILEHGSEECWAGCQNRLVSQYVLKSTALWANMSWKGLNYNGRSTGLYWPHRKYFIVTGL